MTNNFQALTGKSSTLFFWTTLRLSGINKNKVPQLYLPPSCLGIVFRQLPPIAGVSGRYNGSSTMEFWIFGLAGWHGRKGVCTLMLPDMEKYLPYLEEIDLPKAKKLELIHTVAAIMESFVDQAFGLHPVQLCLDGRGSSDSPIGTDRIDSQETDLTKPFERATAKGPEGGK